MGSRSVNFFFDQVIVKEPGTVQRTPWHQDLPYWAVKGSQICAIWLALDPVAAENSVEYVLGSHRWGTEYSPSHFADGSLYEGTGLPPLPDIDAHRSEYQICSWDIEPGDCLVFHAMMVHGAAGNNSLAHRRRAVSTRWCPAGRLDVHVQWMPMLVIMTASFMEKQRHRHRGDPAASCDPHGPRI